MPDTFGNPTSDELPDEDPYFTPGEMVQARQFESERAMEYQLQRQRFAEAQASPIRPSRMLTYPERPAFYEPPEQQAAEMPSDVYQDWMNRYHPDYASYDYARQRKAHLDIKKQWQEHTDREGYTKRLRQSASATADAQDIYERLTKDRAGQYILRSPVFFGKSARQAIDIIEQDPDRFRYLIPEKQVTAYTPLRDETGLSLGVEGPQTTAQALQERETGSRAAEMGRLALPRLKSMWDTIGAQFAGTAARAVGQDDLADWSNRHRDTINRALQKVAPGTLSELSTGVAPAIIQTFAAAATGGAGAIPSVFAMDAYNTSLTQAKELGLKEGSSQIFAGTNAALAYATGLIFKGSPMGIDAVLEQPTKKAAAKLFATQYAKMFGEQTAITAATLLTSRIAGQEVKAEDLPDIGKKIALDMLIMHSAGVPVEYLRKNAARIVESGPSRAAFIKNGIKKAMGIKDRERLIDVLRGIREIDLNEQEIAAINEPIPNLIPSKAGTKSDISVPDPLRLTYAREQRTSFPEAENISRMTAEDAVKAGEIKPAAPGFIRNPLDTLPPADVLQKDLNPLNRPEILHTTQGRELQGSVQELPEPKYLPPTRRASLEEASRMAGERRRNQAYEDAYVERVNRQGQEAQMEDYRRNREDQIRRDERSSSAEIVRNRVDREPYTVVPGSEETMLPRPDDRPWIKPPEGIPTAKRTMRGLHGMKLPGSRFVARKPQPFWKPSGPMPSIEGRTPEPGIGEPTIRYPEGMTREQLERGFLDEGKSPEAAKTLATIEARRAETPVTSSEEIRQGAAVGRIGAGPDRIAVDRNRIQELMDQGLNLTQAQLQATAEARKQSVHVEQKSRSSDEGIRALTGEQNAAIAASAPPRPKPEVTPEPAEPPPNAPEPHDVHHPVAKVWQANNDKIDQWQSLLRDPDTGERLPGAQAAQVKDEIQKLRQQNLALEKDNQWLKGLRSSKGSKEVATEPDKLPGIADAEQRKKRFVNGENPDIGPIEENPDVTAMGMGMGGMSVPPPEGGINMGAPNPAGKSLWKRIKEKFLSRGALPTQAAFEASLQANREIAAKALDTQQVIKKGQKIYDSLTERERYDVNQFLHGHADISVVPERARDVVRSLREHTSGLSQELIDRGMFTGTELEATILENKDVYLNRSFKVHKDPKDHRSRVTEETKQDARRGIEEAYREQGINATPEEVEGMIDHLLAPEVADLVGQLESLPSQYKGILKKKQVLSDWFRKLLGEEQDPLTNVINTAIKLNGLIAHDIQAEAIKREGIGSFLFERPTTNSNGRYITEITLGARKDKTFYTTPEIAEALNPTHEQRSTWVKVLMSAIHLQKFSATIGNQPMGTTRNLLGNGGIMTMQGHIFSPSAMRQAVKTMYAQTIGEGQVAYRQELIRAGIAGEDVNAADLVGLATNIMRHEDPLDYLLPGHKAGLQSLVKHAKNLYQVADLGPKVVGYEIEKASYRAAFPEWTEQQVQAKAAQIIRDVYPTNSYLSAAAKLPRSIPFIGNFTSFPAEILRNTGNTMQLIVQEMKDPRTRKFAARRIGGMLANVYMPAAIAALSRWATGNSQEEEDALRRSLPWWSKDGTVLWLNKVENGISRHIDFSYMDPYKYIRDPIMTFMRGDERSALEKIQAAADNFASPWLQENMVVQRIFDVARNKKKSGAKVHLGDADPEKNRKIMQHLYGAIEPGIFRQMGNMLDAAQGKVDDFGRVRRMADEAMALAGQRVITTNHEQTLLFKARDYAQATTEAASVVRDRLRSKGNVTDQDILRANQSTDRVRQELFREMHKDVRAMQVLGLSERSIMKAMELGGIGKEEARHIVRGTYHAYRPQELEFRQRLNQAKAAPQPALNGF